MTRLNRLLLLIATSLAGACSDATQFTTRTAAGFARTGHRVSVLGVYKDGRLNPDVWEQIGPGLAASLGGQCGLGYDALVGSNPTLSGSIDDYTRANGIGDELLTELAPAATGDVILVVTIAGQVASSKLPNLPDTGSTTSSAPGAMSNKYRGPSLGQTPTSVMRAHRPGAIADGTSFEMSASFFSVADHRSVGLVAMHYGGQSVDEAITQMADRLRREMPGLACAGWSWEGVDEKSIKALDGGH
jgi:hypothetical protein